jgi:hypothetical protein
VRTFLLPISKVRITNSIIKNYQKWTTFFTDKLPPKWCSNQNLYKQSKPPITLFKAWSHQKIVPCIKYVGTYIHTYVFVLKYIMRERLPRNWEQIKPSNISADYTFFPKGSYQYHQKITFKSHEPKIWPPNHTPRLTTAALHTKTKPI